MPPLPCPECGREIPDSAPACTGCGRPAAESEPDEEFDALIRAGERVRAIKYLVERKGMRLPDAVEAAVARERELGVTPA